MKQPIEAILFDLDGTLLDLEIGTLLPPYIKALAASAAHLVPPDRFVPCLMEASEAMATNDGRETNEAVFARLFYPGVGCSREELEPVFAEFYAAQFPKLRHYARRKPEARLAVQVAFDNGYDVVIATNPLFPAVAIQQRLEWAGVANFPYRLVTSYENSRAAKPNLLYFRHILEAIDHSPESCWVVGDEDFDMVAACLGCTTFLVPSARTELAPTTPDPTYRGELTDLITLLRDAR